jgi:hypothetical protein
MEHLEQHLAADDRELATQWNRVEAWISQRFGRDTSIEAILFLIGVQSRGCGYEPEMAKEKKQDAIMEGTHCAFEKLGLYERIGLDEDGFWIWERSVSQIPSLPIDDQEKLLKLGIVRYFEDVLEADEGGGP